MVAPNLGGYKASFDFYFEPWSNLYGWMDNNTRVSTEDVYYKKRHRFKIANSLDVAAPWTVEYAKRVAPGSFLDFMGLPYNYSYDMTSEGPKYREFPAEKYLGLLDIYRNYYVNDQEEYCYVVGDEEAVIERGGNKLHPLSLSGLDFFFKQLRTYDDGLLWAGVDDPISGLPHMAARFCSLVNGGLPVRTYRMDLNRGILNAKVGEFKSKVSITDNGFTIDTLRFHNKLQKFIDRVDLSGGRFSDMMRARWGVTPRGSMNIPDYLGSVSEFFGCTDVISTAAGDSQDNNLGNRGKSVLGQQAGFAVGSVNRNRNSLSFRADQYGTFYVIFSLVPIVTYSQGIELENLKTNFAEIYDPAFKQLGYQDVQAVELAAGPRFGRRNLSVGALTPTSLYSAVFPLYDDPDAYADRVVGKRIAWSEYMSSLPRAHGYFASGADFDYWVNNRVYMREDQGLIFTDAGSATPQYDTATLEEVARYTRQFGPRNFSTYIDPTMQNHLFVDQSVDAHNFRLRANFDFTIRRLIGNRIMPHM